MFRCCKSYRAETAGRNEVARLAKTPLPLLFCHFTSSVCMSLRRVWEHSMNSAPYHQHRFSKFIFLLIKICSIHGVAVAGGFGQQLLKTLQTTSLGQELVLSLEVNAFHSANFARTRRLSPCAIAAAFSSFSSPIRLPASDEPPPFLEFLILRLSIRKLLLVL
jgi:hypothetical protein